MVMGRVLCRRAVRFLWPNRIPINVVQQHFSSTNAQDKQHPNVSSVRVPRWGLPLADGVFGTVSELLCDVGARVNRDEAVAVVDTDKIAFEIKAPCDGIVTGVHVSVGDEVAEQQEIYSLRQEDGESFDPSREDNTAQDRAWARDRDSQKEKDRQQAELDWLRMMEVSTCSHTSSPPTC